MNVIDKPKIIIICGPTASGKTSVAIRLAQVFHGEIINADSIQIFKCMDIGSAKPDKADLARVCHHMIDIVKPDEPFDAAIYAKAARDTIFKIINRKILPFVAGGAGLYIKALERGMFITKSFNKDIRKQLEEKKESHGTPYLYKELCLRDPEAAKKIHANDTYRILRALEVIKTTGTSIFHLQGEHKFSDEPFSVLKIGLRMDREVLYDRINRRVDDMISGGLLDEVKRLISMGYKPSLKSMQSLGYRHMCDFIENRISWDEAVRTMKRDTRRYAKRQGTWFKADSKIIWLRPDEHNKMNTLISEFVCEGQRLAY